VAIVLLALPPIKNQPLPVQILNDADLVLISANAARKWQSIDQQMVELITASRKEKPMLVLNNVHTDNLKDFFGKIPIRTFFGRNRSIYK
jgi:hypothetical protein